MSGGALNYLCQRLAWQHQFTSSEIPDLRDVAGELDELGHADAAAEVRTFIARIQQLWNDADRLFDVLQAVEWHSSGDWKAERIAEAAEALKQTRSADDGGEPPLRPTIGRDDSRSRRPGS